MPEAYITNIQGYSIHDGPGIRTVAFFKGCGLACRWCANPEGLSARPQIGFIEKLCSHCGKCVEACPNGAIQTGDGEHRVDYSRCQVCGQCVEACYYDALVKYGKPMTVDELFDAVRRDKMFYEGSGGGVTASGGEPLLHADFVRALFEKCHDDGINTAIETCGFVRSENLLQVLPLTDHVMFDLKLMDSEQHRLYTGQPNELILKNARLAVENHSDVLFRMPLIPGVNSTEENLRATAAFLNGLDEPARRLQLMPYHRMGQSKYAALNVEYTLPELKVMEAEEVNAVRDTLIELGIDCSISK